MSAWEIGQRVQHRNPLGRRYVVPWHKAWVPRRTDWSEGVLVGLRTLSDGKSKWSHHDGGMTYEPMLHFAAALIVTDLRRKPFYVRIEDVRPL